MVSATVMCLALNLYYEGRSEIYMSRIAIAQVTLNRVSSPKYPNTVCEVVKQKDQFSWYWDGLSDNPREKGAWSQAKDLAALVLKYPDTVKIDCVGSALHYHATYVNPYWNSHLKKHCVVGSHIYYGDRKNDG